MKKKERTFLIILTAVTAIISLLFYVNIFDLVIAAIISLIVSCYIKRGSISIAICLRLFLLFYSLHSRRNTYAIIGISLKKLPICAYGVYPYRQIKVLSYNMISKNIYSGN